MEGAPARVCVVSGRRIDELGPVMNDCTSGGVPLACPGEAGGLRCAHERGFAVVSGDDLALAFEMQDAEDEDRRQRSVQPPMAGSPLRSIS